ncbi:MAG: alkaline phosphatase D family protein [Pseudomonadota bacterium]
MAIAKRFFLGLVLGVCSVCSLADLVAGPMPGWIGVRSAVIWAQFDTSEPVTITYWSESIAAESQTAAVDPIERTARFHLTNLTPGIEYQYTFSSLPGASESEYVFRTQPLWFWREPPPDFTVALGSCSYINDPPLDRPGKAYGGQYEIFDAIADTKPTFMMWLGDNLYFREADFLSSGGLAYRYRYQRRFPQLQRLLQSTHHVAVWDDHDYGPNDANSSFILREQALALFSQYWSNPSAGTAETAGIFTTFTYSDAQFFLLDDRYHRDADKLQNVAAKSLYGDEQLAWLRNALVSSRSRFKFIVGGSEFLSRHRFEGWHNFPKERKEFLNWLSASDIKGIIFLSGDRHFTKLSRYDRTDRYPLFELTCSPLSARAVPQSVDINEPGIVTGTVVQRRNFCSLGFSGQGKARALSIAVQGSDGRPLWRREFAAGDFQ